MLSCKLKYIGNFEIDLSFVPVYGVNLTLEKKEISMEQGETVNLSITITNLGNIVDEIIPVLDSGTLGEDVILEGDGNLIAIGANESFIGKITLRVGNDRDAGEYAIKISVRSVGDISGNTMVERTLIVTVLKSSGDDDTGDDVDDDTDDDSDDSETGGEKNFLAGSLFIILMVGFFLLVLGIILLIMIRKRKKDKPDDEPTKAHESDAEGDAGGDAGGEKLPVMELKEPPTEENDPGNRETGEEPNPIPGEEPGEQKIAGSTGPECARCGGVSDYYEEYDCFWCEACQVYVDEEETTGEETEKEDPLTKEENISSVEETSTDEVKDEGEVMETDADASEAPANETTSENEMKDEGEVMGTDADASEPPSNETTSENEMKDEVESAPSGSRFTTQHL